MYLYMRSNINKSLINNFSVNFRTLQYPTKRYISNNRYGNFVFHDRLQYLLDVKNRVLPNLRLYDQSGYNKLLSSRSVVTYFKNIRQLQEYPGLVDLFRRKGFDLSLYYKIKSENENTRSTFFDNLISCHSTITSKSKASEYNEITCEDLKFLEYRIINDMFPNHVLSSFTRPTIDELIFRINLKASQGMPEPKFKKRDVLNEIIYLVTKFYKGDLKISDIILYPTATLMRLQIRPTGLKARIVHAVQATVSVLESYYYLWFMSGLPLESCIKIGLTQKQISDHIVCYKDYNTVCFDYSKWDLTRKHIFSILSFEIISRFLKLTSYETKILKFLRNNFLTVPMFHPIISFATRVMGTVSGSGFTSLDNSVCNYCLFIISYHRYMIRKGLDPYQHRLMISVCGDDLVFGSEFKIDSDEFASFVSSEFGVRMGVELPNQKPGINKAYFLGSLWKDGKPLRIQKVMVASVIFGSGNFPKMSTYELATSRFLEVFGNSSDCLRYWKRLGLPLPTRIFDFSELKEHREQTRGKLIPRSDISRGTWVDVSLGITDLSTLWMQR